MTDALQFIKSTNPVVSDGHYHTTEHAIQVHRTFSKIYKGLYVNPKPATELSACCAYLACLFHDYNHSCGAATEEENIERAVAGLRMYQRFSVDNDYNAFITPITKHLFDEAEKVIRLTAFPHTDDEEDRWYVQAVREADVLASIVEHDVVSVMEGLRKERAVALGRDVTYTEMLDQQREFYKNLMRDGLVRTHVGIELLTERGPAFRNLIEDYCAAMTTQEFKSGTD